MMPTPARSLLGRVLSSLRPASPGPAPDLSLDGRSDQSDRSNPLYEFFNRNLTGPGLWKWHHYFDVYHRHLAKFRGSSANVLEIGVYSGGSLRMWREYFGATATIHGVDIEPACKVYEGPSTRIAIGDQGDPDFWRGFKATTPLLDVVIDDGSHVASDQITSLTELLPHMRPGGVYLCEDVFRPENEFVRFVWEIASSLYEYRETERSTPSTQVFHATGWQTSIESVAIYPFVAIVTKSPKPVSEFVCAKHGTEWQPFFD
jgi:hypothetical protein